MLLGSCLLLLVASVVVAKTPNPLPGSANITVRDPSIAYNPILKKYFVFGTGARVRIFTADSLTGPWKRDGSLLPKECSKIDLPLKCEPWAPDVTRMGNGTYAVYYSVSTLGKQESAIGLATSPTMEPGTWTDHGAMMSSHQGGKSNSIDANVFWDGTKPIFTYGSYWGGIFRRDMPHVDVLQGAMPGAHVAGGNGRPVEGGFMYRPRGSEWYYYFFSDGITPLGGATSHPAPGHEYKVRVGRAKSATGPFLDKKGRKITDGNKDDPAGSIVLASHDSVYAPGGQSVFRDPVSGKDVMVYHYVSLKDEMGGPSYLGINYISFKGGWPAVVEYTPPKPKPTTTTTTRTSISATPTSTSSCRPKRRSVV